MKHVVIIGNGISGITAAREIRKRSDSRITVISGESAHFFSRTALMYVYMGHMRYADIKPYPDDFWATNRIVLKRSWVRSVDTAAKRVAFEDGGTMAYDSLLIASGSRTNKFGWPGQDLPGVQGLYSLQDLETMERDTKGISRAVIVGGGLIGVEMAEMLLSRRIAVTFLVREDLFWGGVLPQQEARLIGRHIAEHGVDLRFNTELDGILPGKDGRARSVVTKSGEEITGQFVGITTGVAPNIAFLKDSGIACDRGVLVNEFLETNVPDVYAAGDCAQFHEHPDPERRPVEQVWYAGRMMGATVARTITDERMAYAPGPWFNSAKFFDIEYQTYGWVRNRLMPGQAEHYWEHRDGRIALHLVWDEEDRRFIGLNAFGMRLRHGVLDRWLREGVSVDHVVERLHEANFDPEFFARHEKAIRAGFNAIVE